MRQHRACIMFYCPALSRLFRTNLLFRLSEWKSQTSKHLKVSEQDVKWLLYSNFTNIQKYANTEMQPTYLCTQNGGQGSETCSEMLLVNYSCMHLVLCLNSSWDELDVACRHTPFLWDNRWTYKSIKDCIACLHSETLWFPTLLFQERVVIKVETWNSLHQLQ